MSVELERKVHTYAAYLDEVLPTITADEIQAETYPIVPPEPAKLRMRPALVAVTAAIATMVLIGGVAWLLGGTGSEAVDEPIPVTTLPIEVTVPVVPPTTNAGAYNLDDALTQVERFHGVWNDVLFDHGDENPCGVPCIVAGLRPDSIHRQDQLLIDIAVNGFHAQVEAQCTATPGADSDRANVTCHVLVEDDFYTSSVGIRLRTEVVYEVTADGIDILDGDPIWAIEPTGTALAFLEDFDAALAGPLGGMTDPFGWIWLDSSVGTPNWGDGPPLRAYSVETVQGSFVAISVLGREFLDIEGDPWESISVASEPIIPTPQTQPRACPMPVPISDIAFEAWFADLHGAIGTLVEDTNSLGLVLLEIEDFSPGWENREPVSSTLAPLVADIDTIESMATIVLQDNFGATYSKVSGWRFPEALAHVPPGISHLEELSYFPTYYRSDVMPAFFEMRSQGTAIAYFNGGGVTSGPCGMTASMVLLLDTMTESGQFHTP
jgi:hypothetical protein